MKPSRYQITTSQNGKNQQGPFICREIRRFFLLLLQLSREKLVDGAGVKVGQVSSFFSRSSLEHQVVAVADFLLLLLLRTIKRRKKVKGKRPRFGSRLGEGKKSQEEKEKQLSLGAEDRKKAGPRMEGAAAVTAAGAEAESVPRVRGRVSTSDIVSDNFHFLLQLCGNG